MPESVPLARRFASTFGPAIAIVAVQQIFFQVPTGTEFRGAIVGMLAALVAIGMALIYRANRILNFAQGDLGVLPTALALYLIQLSGLNYFAGLSIGLATALLLGALVELTIIRRFFRAPRLILTVATIGISQLLAVGALFLPLLWGEEPLSSEPLHPPIDWTFNIGVYVFNFNDVLALVVAPLAMIGVALFLRYTNVGIAIRASAESGDRAGLLGIPVKRLQTVVWTVATVFSFIGLFLRAGIMGLPLGPTLSMSLLLPALAALMLGRLSNLPTIASCAVALGMLDQAVYWCNTDANCLMGPDIVKSPQLIDPILGVVIVVGLLTRKLGASRAEQTEASSWQAAEEVRAIPRELRRIPEVLAMRFGVGALVAAALLWFPHWQLGMNEPGNVVKGTAVLIFAIVGVSVVVLTGWAGQVSLGQMSFVAVGSVVAAKVTTTWHADITVAALAAGVAGAIVAVLVGLPALRLRGLFLAVTTLAFALASSSYLLNSRFFGYVPDERIERLPLLGRVSLDTPARMYYLALGFLTIVLACTKGIRNSRTGRVIIALRENERATQSYGVSAVRAKLTAFAISGFIAAVAGALMIYLLQDFGESLYYPDQSFTVFIATVVGGLGSLSGAVLGALLLKGLPWLISSARAQLLATAAGVLLVLIALPGGLGGLVYRTRDLFLRWVAVRRDIVVPSLLADVRQVDLGALGAAGVSDTAMADVVEEGIEAGVAAEVGP